MKKPNRALITGASSGIGAAFARLLATRGTHLVLAARRTEQLNELAQELRENHHVEVEVVTVDLTLPNAPEILFEAATREGKTVDMLINNAGAGPYRAFLSTPMKDHLSILQLNSVALTAICHLFGEHMIQHGRPSWILNVASVASYQTIPRFAVYCGTKSYVRVFSEIFGYELKGTNVSVSCLCPGGTATDFLNTNNQKLKKGGEKFLMTPQTVAKIGLRGALRGERVIIPGIVNKVASFFGNIMPNSLNMWTAENAIGIAIGEADDEKSLNQSR